MPVLLLRLAGPMQAWGTQSRFTVRDTDREPSKSGVVGLLAAALGVPRDDEQRIARIAALRMGVRVDREGQVATDFHTAGGGTVPGREHYGVYKANKKSPETVTSHRRVHKAKKKPPETVTSHRHYLCDADFLVGMEGDDRSWLEELDAALANPSWPLFLGRKSFVPSVPVRIGVKDGSLEEVLRTHPWHPRAKNDSPQPLRLLIETTDPTEEARYDQPVSFDVHRRRYRLRYIKTDWVAPDEIVIAAWR